MPAIAIANTKAKLAQGRDSLLETVGLVWLSVLSGMKYTEIAFDHFHQTVLIGLTDKTSPTHFVPYAIDSITADDHREGKRSDEKTLA